MGLFSRKSKAERIMENADKLMSEMEDLKAQTWSSIADISKKMQEASSPEEIEELSAQLQAIAKANQSVLGMGFGAAAPSGQVTASGMPVREYLSREEIDPGLRDAAAAANDASSAVVSDDAETVADSSDEETSSQEPAEVKQTPETEEKSAVSKPAVVEVSQEEIAPVQEVKKEVAPQPAEPVADSHSKADETTSAAIEEQPSTTASIAALFDEVAEPASKPKRNKIGLTRAPAKKKEKKPEIATNMNPYTSLSMEDQLFDYFTTSSVETYKSQDQITNKIGSGATGKFAPIVETEKRSAVFEEAVARATAEIEQKKLEKESAAPVAEQPVKAAEAQVESVAQPVDQQDDFLEAAAELAQMHAAVEEKEKARLSVDQTQALSSLDTGQISIPPEAYVAAGEQTVREKALLSDEDKALASLEETDATSVISASAWVQGDTHTQVSTRKATMKGATATIARAHRKAEAEAVSHKASPPQASAAPTKNDAVSNEAHPIPEIEKEMADFKYVSSSKDGRLALYEDESGHFSIVDTSRFS